MQASKQAPCTVSTGTATSLTLQVINNTDAKLTFQLIFCFAKLQSEVDGGNTISYKICFVPLVAISSQQWPKVAKSYLGLPSECDIWPAD